LKTLHADSTGHLEFSKGTNSEVQKSKRIAEAYRCCDRSPERVQKRVLLVKNPKRLRKTTGFATILREGFYPRFLPSGEVRL
jgi:hypothetical protein